MLDAKDRLVTAVCTLTGTLSASQALDRIAEAGRTFARLADEGQAAEIARSLEETEIQAVQMEAVRNTGRSCSVDEARETVRRRRPA